MRVFVKNMRGEPLMPCSQRKARLLLKEGKAKIIGYKPFTIQLLSPTGESTQDVHIGVDTGAKHIGIAVTSKNKVLAKGEVELRDGIHECMKRRSLLRKARRGRKTRYRKPRFLNRKHNGDWLPPTINSKINATFKWIDTFNNLLPNPKLHIEVGKFNIDMISNQDNVDCEKDYYNKKYFIFARDEYTCQVCKKKNKQLRIHHILYKSKGGTNRVDNLITVCKECHSSENHQEGGILYDWMKKRKKVKPYNEAVFMNYIKNKIIQRYDNAIITYGYDTYLNRRYLKLDKTHYNDAIAISGIKNIKDNPAEWFYIKQFRKKKRSLHETHPVRGRRKTKNIYKERRNKNVPYRNGLYMNDMAICEGHIGWVYGFSGGKLGKDCILRDINEETINVSTRKSKNASVPFSSLKILCHNNNWQYTLCT